MTDGKADTKEEHEANAWAADLLIPKQFQHELPLLQTKAQVRGFAQEIGIHPGIVVGRLQHEKIILMNWMNELKVSFRICEGGE